MFNPPVKNYELLNNGLKVFLIIFFFLKKKRENYERLKGIVQIAKELRDYEMYFGNIGTYFSF